MKSVHAIGLISAASAALIVGGCATGSGTGDGIGVKESVLRTGIGNVRGVTHQIATGRWVSPVGHLTGTRNFPSSVAVAAGVVYVLANGATRAQSVTGYSAGTLQRRTVVLGFRGAVSGPTVRGVLRIPRENFFQGLAVGRDGSVYVAGGSSDALIVFRPGADGLVLKRRYRLQFLSFPRDQYPYRYQGMRVGKRHFFPDGVTVDPTGRYAFVTGLLSNAVARIDLSSGRTLYVNAGPYPFAPVLTDHGRLLVVSDWGGCGVTIFRSRSLRRVGQVCVGPRTGPNNSAAGVHPTALVAVPDSTDVVFTASNADEAVRVDARALRVVRIFDDSPYPGAPPGSYPDALAIHSGTLYVANAGNDDVALFDLRSGRALGLLPTAWYPTGLAAGPRALYVVAAKGLGSGPNLRHQWVGDMMHGVLQRISFGNIQRHLRQLTGLALADNGFSADMRALLARKNARQARRLRRRIRYVVFILRENKTFDEELGDLHGLGPWANRRLALYGPRELPNLFDWARHDALFVNFYADGEVTAQGHQWTTGASDSDFVQRTWPQYYSGRGLVANPGWTQSLVPGSAPSAPAGVGPAGGQAVSLDSYADSINLSVLGRWSNPWVAYPQRLYLFNDLEAHHISFEDFGEFVSRSQAGDIPANLRAHLARQFPGWDRMVLDTQRARVAIGWMRRHATDLPRFMYIWLPDDHTAGRAPCYFTPDYYVANNDVATARIIHYLSTTPQWRHMLVFVTEDDAQSGADHIDAHRTFAVALGPWVRRTLVTARYSQVNIVRTIEAAFRLPPMSQWDANAAVIGGIWRRSADRAQVAVRAQRVPSQFNPGCRNPVLLRRMAKASDSRLHGPSGNVGSPRRVVTAPGSEANYTPTSLLKVTGREQMRQEWIASKGRASYERTLRYLRRLAKTEHAPLSHYLSEDGED